MLWLAIAPKLDCFGSTSHGPWPVPLATPLRTIPFANSPRPAIRQTLLRLQIPPKSAPLPIMLTGAAFRFLCYVLRSAMCFCLIRRSHFSHQRRSRFRLWPGSSGLRGNASLPPTVRHVVSQLAFSLRPPRSRTLLLPCLLRLFFSANAEMKEKNQASKEGQEKSS
jgi:hypothetical protein